MRDVVSNVTSLLIVMQATKHAIIGLRRCCVTPDGNSETLILQSTPISHLLPTPQPQPLTYFPPINPRRPSSNRTQRTQHQRHITHQRLLPHSPDPRFSFPSAENTFTRTSTTSVILTQIISKTSPTPYIRTSICSLKVLPSNSTKQIPILHHRARSITTNPTFSSLYQLPHFRSAKLLHFNRSWMPSFHSLVLSCFAIF